MFHRGVNGFRVVDDDVAADFFADQRFIHAFVKAHQPLAAGIDDAGFFQHRQQFGRKFNRFVALIDEFGQKRFEILVFGFDLHGVFADGARHGQHGAFLWFAHRAVRHFRAVLQRLREEFRIDGLRFLDAVAESPQNLR